LIVLDEQLNDEQIIEAIEQWYQGKVTTVQALRPNTLIKDDAIPSLLLRQKQPTFVTINYFDFWPKAPKHSAYCLICCKLPTERKLEVPDLLRRVLQLPEFDTWRKRAGKIISVTDLEVRYFG
jgi:hypothetical protein